MAVEDDRPIPGRGPDGGEPPAEVIVELGPPVDVAAAALRTALATVVIAPRVQSGRGELVADMFVASRVLAEAVDEQDVCPRRTGPGPARLGLVRRPVAGRQSQALR